MATHKSIYHSTLLSLPCVDQALRTMLHETRDRQKFVSDVQYLRDMQHKVDSEYQVTAESRSRLPRSRRPTAQSHSSFLPLKRFQREYQLHNSVKKRWSERFITGVVPVSWFTPAHPPCYSVRGH